MSDNPDPKKDKHVLRSLASYRSRLEKRGSLEEQVRKEALWERLEAKRQAEAEAFQNQFKE